MSVENKSKSISNILVLQLAERYHPEACVYVADNTKMGLRKIRSGGVNGINRLRKMFNSSLCNHDCGLRVSVKIRVGVI
jgi:hypothetical protein